MKLNEYLRSKNQYLRAIGVGTRLIEMNTGRITPTATAVMKVSALTGVPALDLFAEFQRRTTARMNEELALLKARLKK